MTDLDKLIKAVEAGDDSSIWAAEHANRTIGPARASSIRAAYFGGLDAAISLYDALLGHDAGWTVSQHIAKVVMGEFGADGVYESVIPRNPARALLLSTLKAYRAQQ